MCFAPQRRALFRHLNFQKWSGAGVFCAFSLRNVLRATTACTFSTSQFPKVVREWCVLYILTSKRAPCHNGVHFFDISTSKSGPRMVCFVHFDFEMCFAPQRRALFRHLNFQMWSDTEDPPEPQINGKTMFRAFPTFSRTCIFFLRALSLLWSSLFGSSPLWLFPPLLFHLSILSDVWLLNLLRWNEMIWCDLIWYDLT